MVIVDKGFKTFKEEYIDTNKLKNINYIFRGCINKDYKLVPSFLRRLTEEDNKGEISDDLLKYLHNEDDNLREFANAYVRKRKHDNVNENFFNLGEPYEFFMVGQHYGISTKLLDFTKNLNVALAFCVYDWGCSHKDDKKDCVLYVLDRTKLPRVNNNVEVFNKILSEDKLDKSDLNKSNSLDFKDFSKLVLEPINRGKSDVRQRIKKQSGCFVYFKDFNKNNFCLNDDICDFKFIFKKEYKKDIISYLKSQKINEESDKFINSIEVLR